MTTYKSEELAERFSLAKLYAGLSEAGQKAMRDFGYVPPTEEQRNQMQRQLLAREALRQVLASESIR